MLANAKPAIFAELRGLVMTMIRLYHYNISIFRLLTAWHDKARTHRYHNGSIIFDSFNLNDLPVNSTVEEMRGKIEKDKVQFHEPYYAGISPFENGAVPDGMNSSFTAFIAMVKTSLFQNRSLMKILSEIYL